MKFVTDLAAEIHGRMRNSEKNDGKRGDNEVVEANLLCAIDIRTAVELGQSPNRILGDFDDDLGMLSVVHNASHGIQDGSVEENAHLVRP